MIDLTGKVDKGLLHPTKHQEELPKTSRKNTINFSGTINTDTHTIEGQYYNTTNSTVMGNPKTIGSPSLDELYSKLDKQARLLSEQQKVIHGMQHSQNKAPQTPDLFSHQSLPNDPSIPSSTLVSTSQRMNDFDGERTVQVDGAADIPQPEYTRPDHKQLNRYPERYNNDYPSHPYRDQDFDYDDKAHIKREPMLPHSQSDPIKSDDNSNLLDDTLTQLSQSQNDIHQKTCELLSSLSNKPPSAEFMHDILTDVTVYNGKNIPLEHWLLQIEKAQQFTSLPHYDIALHKSIDTPYNQLSRVDRSKPWESIKKMLQEAHAPYPVKLSAITNMFRKQKADETLQDYIQYFIDQTETALGHHPMDVTKYIYYVLFSQGLYNSHLKRKVQGATNIKCLNDAFKIA